MKIDGRKFIPSQLHNLLLAKNKGGMTALLVACKFKDPALIEHLVTAKAAAGENLEDVDREGRTAIILSVSSEEEDRIPTEKLSPKIFKVNIFMFYNILAIKSFCFKTSSCTKPSGRKRPEAMPYCSHWFLSFWIVGAVGKRLICLV